MEIKFDYSNNSERWNQLVYLSLADIEELITQINKIWDWLSKQCWLSPKNIDEWFVYNNEDKIAILMNRLHLLNQINNKIKWEIKHIYTPLIKRSGNTNMSLDINVLWEQRKIILNYENKVSEKFNFSETRSHLQTIYNISHPEERLSYEHYLEEIAWFGIAKTNLEETLSKKGYLDDQIIEWVEQFVSKEEVISKSIIPPLYWSYDPAWNTTIIFNDIVTKTQDWYIYIDPMELLVLYYIINNSLQYSYITEKAKKIILEDDLQLRNLTISEKVKYSIKFGWLFEDNKWNKIDVIDALIDIFQLSDDEVNDFVNSRKRNLIDMPDGNTIFYYFSDKEDFKIEL